MASALKSKSRADVIIYSDGGISDIKTDNAFSWNALTSLERLGKILFSGKNIWHLWGDAPSWWGLVRLHARTVHTLSLNNFNNKNFKWQGHPSKLFPDKALNGEAVLIPSFETKVSNNDDNNNSDAPAVYAGLKNSHESLSPVLDDLNIKIDGRFVPVIDTGDADFNLNSSQAKSGVFISSPSNIFDALKAAVLTMQGLTVVSQKSEYLDALLGADGYFINNDLKENAWRDIIFKALSEQGRRAAVSARHFIKNHFSAEKCADSFLELYKKVAGAI